MWQGTYWRGTCWRGICWRGICWRGSRRGICWRGIATSLGAGRRFPIWPGRCLQARPLLGSGVSDNLKFFMGLKSPVTLSFPQRSGAEHVAEHLAVVRLLGGCPGRELSGVWRGGRCHAINLLTPRGSARSLVCPVSYMACDVGCHLALPLRLVPAARRCHMRLPCSAHGK